MSFSSLLFNIHLLLSIYTLFILWKDDRLSRGNTLDDIAIFYQTTASRNSIMLTMLVLCVVPILNLITLYRLALAEIETTRIGWVLWQKRIVRYKGGFIMAGPK